MCKFEGGTLATYDQLEAARQIGLHHTYKSHLDQMPKGIVMEIVMGLAYSISAENQTSHVIWIKLNSLYYNNKQSETISKQNDNQHSHRYIKYLHTSYKRCYKPSPVPPSVMFELLKSLSCVVCPEQEHPFCIKSTFVLDMSSDV